MAQRYSNPIARDLLEHGLCPECGMPPTRHSDDPRFWIPRACDLLPRGVTDRIAQYRADCAASQVTASSEAVPDA